MCWDHDSDYTGMMENGMELLFGVQWFEGLVQCVELRVQGLGLDGGSVGIWGAIFFDVVTG